MRTCPECNGNGKYQGTIEAMVCTRCKGTGRRPEREEKAEQARDAFEMLHQIYTSERFRAGVHPKFVVRELSRKLGVKKSVAAAYVTLYNIKESPA